MIILQKDILELIKIIIKEKEKKEYNSVLHFPKNSPESKINAIYLY